jgi:nucleoid-associated protein YgaU
MIRSARRREYARGEIGPQLRTTQPNPYRRCWSRFTNGPSIVVSIVVNIYPVTCFHCTNVVEISPDASLCPLCGEDLQNLLAADDIVHYFQTRVHALSDQGQFATALTEAERGLTFAAAGELRLLAAILAKQLGQPDRMRKHVAAIAVDDSLRGEAEWLVRSYQDPQRALRDAPRPAPTAVTGAGRKRAAAPQPAVGFLDELLGGEATPVAVAAPRTALATWLSVAMVALALGLVVASWWWIGPGALPKQADENPESAGLLPQATPELVPMAATDAPASAEAGVPTPSLLPTPTPQTVATPLPDTLTAAPAPSAEAAGAEVAEAGPRPVLIIGAEAFDLASYLRAAGEPELAALPVEARLVEETLVLQGFVQLDLQRRRLIQLLQSAPGVRQVNAVDLLVRPLPTYVVQEGDTLWSIVYNIYGNVDRLDEFAAANRAVLPAPDALAPGIELQVLPSR